MTCANTYTSPSTATAKSITSNGIGSRSITPRPVWQGGPYEAPETVTGPGGDRLLSATQLAAGSVYVRSTLRTLGNVNASLLQDAVEDLYPLNRGRQEAKPVHWVVG